MLKNCSHDYMYDKPNSMACRVFLGKPKYHMLFIFMQNYTKCYVVSVGTNGANNIKTTYN